jgi:hypothetical protein
MPLTMLADSATNGTYDVVGASVAGILVALLTYYLATRRANLDVRRASDNARTLLALEMGNNADALRGYWDQMHRLDKDFVPGKPMTDDQLKEHLTAMVNANWVGGYVLPKWSVVRWEGFPASALGSISGKQLAEIDAGYRDLSALRDAYDKFMYVSPEERTYLESMSGRFWALHFADARVEAYKALDAQVQRVIQNQPLRSTL